MKLTRRTLLAALAAGIAMPARAQAGPIIDVVKTPTCGCCNGWIAHLRSAGFRTRVRDVPDTTPFARRLGVPDDLRSCHTASVGGYAVEAMCRPPTSAGCSANGRKRRASPCRACRWDRPGWSMAGIASPTRQSCSRGPGGGPCSRGTDAIAVVRLNGERGR